ncbi:MAG: (Fe-S)-binding protein [Deltaproteobacteria bacterium]|nr:(Fe-S)-binding protein [Deltaproteobacteria bacterium]
MEREVFRNFSTFDEVLFYVLANLAMAIFAYGIFLKVRKYRRGRAAYRFDHLPQRLLRALAIAAGSTTIAKNDRFAGVAHAAILWGFVALFIGTTIIFIDNDILGVVAPSLRFWRGRFYLWYSLVLDLMGAAFVAGVALMWLRRKTFGLPQLDYSRVDYPPAQYSRLAYVRGDDLFLGLFFAIGVTGFLIEGLRIAADRPPFEVWSPVGWALADAIDLAGLSAPASSRLHFALWWLHGILALAFVAYLPFSKALHMLTDFANLMFRDDLAARRLPRPAAEPAPAHLGVETLGDLSWRNLLELDACTKCGRCHVACPARAAGAPLSPRDLVLDLREYADARLARPALEQPRFLGEHPSQKPDAILPGGVIQAETLWSCTTCRACVSACPVGIEHVPLIVEMRRRLVEEGAVEDSLREALESLGKRGNSFKQSDKLRGRWTKDLAFPVKDARKQPVEVLWFVGDYASYNPRLQEISRAVARLFHRAGLDFGILYDGEKNAGNDVRRVGEEGLFEMLAEHNVATLAKCRFGEIVTTDPHSLNTLKNEYPELGGRYTVSHYSEVLLRLVEDGRLTLNGGLGRRGTYHDPCYLGRYNGIYEAPRRLIEHAGVSLVEMPRSRENSFCCGAGGGRIWMDDSALAERPSESRIAEAIALGGVDYFVVACPKDVTMYEDAVKTSGNEGKIRVRDIAELVEEALAAEEAPGAAQTPAAAGAAPEAAP